MDKRKRYYSLVVHDNEADIYIYGDIVSWEWFESDVSSYTLSKEIEGLEVDKINVFINSYGGEVAEGLAIYNQLRRHKAKVVTYCDGFACSAASVVFMAGDERIMSNASLLMIHNVWSWAAGDSKALRKQADDLEIMTQAAVNAYMKHVTISEETLKQMMDDETWISPQDALEMGFATSVVDDPANRQAANQNARRLLVQLVLGGSRNKPPVEPNSHSKPQSEPEPEPESKGLFNFLAALADHLIEEEV